MVFVILKVFRAALALTERFNRSPSRNHICVLEEIAA
jgi:hypothetical protein